MIGGRHETLEPKAETGADEGSFRSGPAGQPAAATLPAGDVAGLNRAGAGRKRGDTTPAFPAAWSRWPAYPGATAGERNADNGGYAMTTFVLLVWLATSGAGGDAPARVDEYGTRAACEKAGEAWEAAGSSWELASGWPTLARWVCLPGEK